MIALKLNLKAALLTPFFLLVLPHEDAQAKGRLSPTTKKNIRESNLSFKNCRRDALKLMKEGKLSPKRFKARLTGCKERYPGASLFINCKKEALKSHKNDKNTLKKALRECKKLLVAAVFEPTKPLPFFVQNNQQYFAGVGFNKPITDKELDLPNFDCSKLKSLLNETEKAEYFLFGNHPSLFLGFQNHSPGKIKQLLKTPGKPPPDGHFVPNLGKIFGSPGAGGKKSTALYFPSGSCVFDGPMGTHFTGLSTYYLIDKKRSRFIPYFSIAFYHPEFKTLSVRTASQQLLDMLNASQSGGGGKALKMFSQKEDMNLIAPEKIKEFEEEGDPMNVCAQPRAHQTIAVLKGRGGTAEQLEYIILANIKNLCTFGDIVTKDFKPS